MSGSFAAARRGDASLQINRTMLRPAPRGIGFYLVVLILIAVVPLVITAVVLVARQSELQREAFEKSLLQTALALSVAVDRQLNTYQVMLETLAQSEDLDRGRIQPFHELSARAATQHGAVFVSLFDRDGKQIFNTLRPPGRTRSGRRSAIRAGCSRCSIPAAR